MRDCIHMKVSLVVSVIDDFTGQVLNGNDVKVMVKGAKPPVRKMEGYFVFLNLTESFCKIMVESYQYQDAEMEVDLRQIEGAYPLVKVRVKPDWVYRLPRGSTSLSGYGKPNKELIVIPHGSTDFFKLLFPYPDKKKELHQITIYNPEGKDLEGQQFEISDEEGQQKERFTIIKQLENGCLLKKPLKETYKKVGTRIYQVYTCRIKKDGRYFLPMWLAGQQKIKCQVYYEEEPEKQRTIFLETGKKNQWDFL